MTFIKNCLPLIAGLFIYTAALSQNKNPELLAGPVNWTFEKFALPPVFAPSFPYHGFEELRFSPGMFVKDSVDYFSYAFAASIDNKTTMTKADISNYLELYFKGLCFATARDRKLTVDTSKIKVSVQQQKDLYYAVLNIFGVFADGAPVTLNMEIKVVASKASSKLRLVFLASPRPKTAGIWKKLYKIRETVK